MHQISFSARSVKTRLRSPQLLDGAGRQSHTHACRKDTQRPEVSEERSDLTGYIFVDGVDSYQRIKGSKDRVRATPGDGRRQWPRAGPGPGCDPGGETPL